MFYKVENGLSERHKDENGYLFVERSPILKAGILEYYGSELLPEGASDVDGVKVDPDEIYKVYIPVEEIEKAKDTFKMIPITDDHTWLGVEGEDPKEYQVGTTGEGIYVEDGFLYAPLKFTGMEIIEEVESHSKEELSSSYYNRLEKSKNPEYDFIARDIKGNHIALVDKGRCGSSVRVLNSIKGVEEMAGKAKTCNEAILKLDGKEIDLDQFFEEESHEMEGESEVHEDSIVENDDKMSVIREIIEVARREDFEGGEDEQLKAVADLVEKLSLSKSENEDVSEEDEETEEEKEEVETENECAENEEDEKEEVKSMNYDSIVAKVSNAMRAEAEKKQASLVKAYNSVRGVIGDFNPFGMTDSEMYIKALNHLGVDLDGDESVAELGAMLKACSVVRGKVDNGFTYSGSTEEVEYNF